MRPPPRALAALGGWLAGFVALGIGMRFGRDIFDEGLILTGAQEMLAGRWPVTGFWAIYPPGAFAWVAGLFLLTGRQMLAMRLVYGAVLALLPAMLAWLLWSETRIARKTGLAAVAGLALWLGAILPNYGYPPPLAATLVLALLLAAPRCDRPERAFACGLGFGVIALLRHDIAAYGWLALAASWLAPARLPGRARLRLVLASGAGAALVLGASLALYAGTRPAADAGGTALAVLWQRLILYPAGPFAAARGLPFPRPFAAWLAHPGLQPGLALDGLVLSATYALAAAAIGLAVAAWRWPAERPGLRAAAWFGLLAWLPFLGRSDLNQAWIGVALASFLLLWRAGPRARLALATGFVLLGGLSLLRQDLPWYRAPSVALASPFARGIRIPAREASYNQVIAAARRATTLYSGPLTHSHVFANDMLLYFLSGHVPPTYFAETEPGITDRAAIQRRIDADLRRARPDLCVLIPQPRNEANRSALDHAAHRTDALLDRHCAAPEWIGGYALRRCRWPAPVVR
ncbi:MAG: hypothetical protein KGL12_01460 [Rhodospirillales bacterium]|nr:hypothetical protein [Rhodospirillales bacterium]